MDSVELMPMLRYILQRITLHKLKRIILLRRNIHPHDLIESGLVITHPGATCPTEQIQQPSHYEFRIRHSNLRNLLILNLNIVIFPTFIPSPPTLYHPALSPTQKPYPLQHHLNFHPPPRLNPLQTTDVPNIPQRSLNYLNHLNTYQGFLG